MGLTDAAFPVVSKHLASHLEEVYPARFPDLDWTDREIWFRAGQRSVVDLLVIEHHRQVKAKEQ
jgi:hypothetical protein